MWDPPGPGIEPVSPALQGRIPNQWATREAHPQHLCCPWWRGWRKMVCWSPSVPWVLGTGSGFTERLQTWFPHIDSHSLDRDVSYKLVMTTQESSAIKALFPRVWEEGEASECLGTKQWSSQPPTVGTWRWLTLHPDHVADTFSFYDFLEISLATRYGMQDFSSATRVQIPAPAVEAWSLNHWITRDVPILWLFHFNSYSQVSLPWQNMLS